MLFVGRTRENRPFFSFWGFDVYGKEDTKEKKMSHEGFKVLFFFYKTLNSRGRENEDPSGIFVTTIITVVVCVLLYRCV